MLVMKQETQIIQDSFSEMKHYKWRIVSNLEDQPRLGMTQHIMQKRKWHPTPVLLPGKIPQTEEPGRLQSMGSLKVGQN